jgi:tetratricopeptide (TPR) repeat protein
VLSVFVIFWTCFGQKPIERKGAEEDYVKPNKFIVLFLLPLVVLSNGMDANEAKVPSIYSEGSLLWNVDFSMASLEEIAQKPEEILKDIDAFWKKDKTLKVVALWHELRHFDELEYSGKSPIDNFEYTLNRIGGLLLHQGDADLAKEVILLNLKFYPKSLGALSGLGDAHLKRGDIDAAIEVYEEILELDPLNIDLEDKINELKRMGQ